MYPPHPQYPSTLYFDATLAMPVSAMRLLVSVSNAADARAALDGGADIIDAKDPSQGSLGAVTAGTLSAIDDTVRSRRPVSAALGDATDESDVGHAARAAAATGLAFVKIGFAGIASVSRARSLLAAALRGAREGSTDTAVIAVAYADASRVESVAPEAMLEIAALAGAAGVLLDTALKDGGGLFAYLDPDAIAAWVKAAHAATLLSAVAGKLDGPGLVTARDLGADIAGVRGAACIGGRGGVVSARRVRALAALLAVPGDHRLQAPNVACREDRYRYAVR